MELSVPYTRSNRQYIDTVEIFVIDMKSGSISPYNNSITVTVRSRIIPLVIYLDTSFRKRPALPGPPQCPDHCKLRQPYSRAPTT